MKIEVDSVDEETGRIELELDEEAQAVLVEIGVNKNLLDGDKLVLHEKDWMLKQQNEQLNRAWTRVEEQQRTIEKLTLEIKRLTSELNELKTSNWNINEGV